MRNPFLKAEWRKLAIANYAVDAKILAKYLPAKTEIDYWNNTCYVSLVGFMFVNTRIKGIAVPFHINFEEVNLRFYVLHKTKDHVRRGVVFIKEIVSKPALTFVANTIYKENYETLPTHHIVNITEDSLNVEYRWKKNNWNSINIEAGKKSLEASQGSEEEFIMEHYWGYTKINEKQTSEYEVNHPRWLVYPVKAYSIQVEFGNVYGQEFEFLSSEKPNSVFLAEGSEIIVREGARV
jgi:uncharacterized protein YqjF (DUF2071 family)